MIKEAYFVNQVAEAIIQARSDNSPAGTQIPSQETVVQEIRIAKAAVLMRDEGVRADRNTFIFPYQLGEVFDEVGRNLDELGAESPIDHIDVWRAEENLRGLPHDAEGFMKRQKQRQEYALIQEEFPIS
jgi:hypothetical protein